MLSIGIGARQRVADLLRPVEAVTSDRHTGGLRATRRAGNLTNDMTSTRPVRLLLRRPLPQLTR